MHGASRLQVQCIHSMQCSGEGVRVYKEATVHNLSMVVIVVTVGNNNPALCICSGNGGFAEIVI